MTVHKAETAAMQSLLSARVLLVTISDGPPFILLRSSDRTWKSADHGGLSLLTTDEVVHQLLTKAEDQGLTIANRTAPHDPHTIRELDWEGVDVRGATRAHYAQANTLESFLRAQPLHQAILVSRAASPFLHAVVRLDGGWTSTTAACTTADEAATLLDLESALHVKAL